jgi:hypothetical protein
MTEPSSDWRVRMGFGLVQYAPLSDERAAIIARETEKERRAEEFEAEQRRQAALERRQEMLMRGAVQHSVGEVLQSVAVGMDRQDRRDAAAEARAAELSGKPRPTVAALLRDAKAERLEREAAAEATPATKADVGKLAQLVADRVQQLKTGVLAITGKNPLP